jgi:hypothetical protein
MNQIDENDENDGLAKEIWDDVPYSVNGSVNDSQNNDQNDDEDYLDDDEYNQNYNSKKYVIPTKTLKIENDIDSFEKLRAFEMSYKKEKLDKFYDYQTSKQKMMSIIRKSPNHIEKLENDKKTIVSSIEQTISRINIRKDEKREKEIEIVKIQEDCEKSIVGKNRFDKNEIKSTFNKKIIEINALIERINNSIDSISDEISEKKKEIEIIDNKIYKISERKMEYEQKIMKIDDDFFNEIVSFQEKYLIDHDEYALSVGITIIKIPIRGFKKEEKTTAELAKDILDNVIKEYVAPEETEDFEEPSTPKTGIEEEINTFQIEKLKRPFPPAINQPIKRPIVPTIASANFGIKPCKDGNICTRKNCTFLHAAGHNHNKGYAEKMRLEREAEIIYESECIEYENQMAKYYNDLKAYELHESLTSREEFPSLGGGFKA